MNTDLESANSVCIRGCLPKSCSVQLGNWYKTTVRAPVYAGMGELWFDNVVRCSPLASRRSPEWKASNKDEANFIDKNRDT